MRTVTLTSLTRSALVVAAALCSACPGPAHPVTVTFHVNVPPSTPTAAAVSLVGDAPALGNGRGPGLTLEKLAEGQFSGKADLEAQSTVHYQIVQHNPDAAELRQDFTDPNRSFTVGAQGAPQSLSLTVARWVPPLGASQAAVLFEVTPAPKTPFGAQLYLTGNAPELGAWKPDAIPLVLRADGKYVTRAGLTKGSTVQFKVTRGSWSTQERGAAAEDIPNHTFTVTDDGGTASVSTLTWQDQEPAAVLTGDLRYERGVASTFLGNTRDVIVWLPVGYSDDTTTRYPVLYMQDGQNLMDPATSFAGEWGVDEAAQRLLRCGQMSPVIIVGVYNTSNRIPEYTQVQDPSYGGGNADNYARFLLQELKPLIDSHYRTRASEPAGIAGSSLGGLVSLYLGYTHPEAFNRVGAVSPSIWWANKDITARYSGLTAKLPLRVWEDIGTDEGSTPADEVANAAAFRDVLVSKGWVLGDDLFYLQVPNADHSEASWSKRIDQVLAYLYPPPAP
jgi:predicted alpha/beta superfamily hydrolase